MVCRPSTCGLADEEGGEMTTFHLAQLNVGRAVAPFDDPAMADFMGRLDEINGLGERSPGFVWRLQGDGGTSTEIRVGDDPLYIVNLTVWESMEALHAFTYRSDHKTVFRRRFDWFERRAGPNVCLWWQPAGTIPTIEDAERRLRHLEEHGPTDEAFTFKQAFPPPTAGDGVAS
jgi:heme-degrading monooxygenase HmoA